MIRQASPRVPKQGQRDRGLARSRFPHQPQHLARGNRERDVADDVCRAAHQANAEVRNLKPDRAGVLFRTAARRSRVRDASHASASGVAEVLREKEMLLRLAISTDRDPRHGISIRY